MTLSVLSDKQPCAGQTVSFLYMSAEEEAAAASTVPYHALPHVFTQDDVGERVSKKKLQPRTNTT